MAIGEHGVHVKNFRVRSIGRPVRAILPAVILHCAEHSHRSEGYPQTTPWFDFTGLASTRHGPQVPIEITFIEGASPITAGHKNWTTTNEELYNNAAGKLLVTAQPLAVGKQVYTEKGKTEPTTATAVCVWTNRYNGKTNVFATTLGHNNVTVADDRYLDLVTHGLLWSVGKLHAADLKPSAKVLLEEK